MRESECAPSRTRRLDEIAEGLPQRAAVLSRLFLTQTTLDVSRTEQWDRFLTFAHLESRAATVDDRELLVLLEALFAECTADDAVRGRRGRDSSYFEWHDTGLVAAMEVLRARRVGRH